MTTIITPKAQKTDNGLLNAYKSKEEVEKLYLDSEAIDKKTIDKLPQPTGWRLLVLPYSGPKKTKGGLVLSDVTQDKIQMTTVCGLVLKMGNLCYKDDEKYPTGPWCKEKDWVIFARYAGSRMEIDGGEIRLLNDDEVLGTIDDPNDILHAF